MKERKPFSLGRWLLILAAGGLLFVSGLVLLTAMFANVTAQTTVGGRQVVARSRGFFGTLGMADDPRGSTVFLSGGQVRVTPSDVIIGGQRIPIPAGCRQIELVPDSAGVQVLFDGQPPRP